MVNNLLNELLGMVYFTGLDLQLDITEQDQEGWVQAPREGENRAPSLPPLPSLLFLLTPASKLDGRLS